MTWGSQPLWILTCLLDISCQSFTVKWLIGCVSLQFAAPLKINGWKPKHHQIDDRKTIWTVQLHDFGVPALKLRVGVGWCRSRSRGPVLSRCLGYRMHRGVSTLADARCAELYWGQQGWRFGVEDWRVLTIDPCIEERKVNPPWNLPFSKKWDGLEFGIGSFWGRFRPIFQGLC